MFIKFELFKKILFVFYNEFIYLVSYVYYLVQRYYFSKTTSPVKIIVCI